MSATHKQASHNNGAECNKDMLKIQKEINKTMIYEKRNQNSNGSNAGGGSSKKRGSHIATNF